MGEQGFPAGAELADADINTIMRMIPHRYPFLLIDRVVEMRAFESCGRPQGGDDE